MAFDGEVALIGAETYENSSGDDTGAAYVFERSEGEWQQQATLVPDDAESMILFGNSVALAGDTALVGAPGKDDWAGAAYVYVRSDGEWERHASLVADDGEPQDYFGYSVALSSDTAIVGAVNNEGPDGESLGAAYVFERADDQWTQRAKLLPDENGRKDQLGSAVALEADTALVGAWGHGEPRRPSIGAAYVFERTDGEWAQRAKLTADDGDATDNLGGSVALEGSTALVAARDDEDPNGELAGSAYVFEREDGEWTQQDKLAAADGDSDDYFGASVALSRDTALVGAVRDEDPNGKDAGTAYVFERTDGTWRRLAKLVPPDGDPEDYFGSSAALVGESALVGALQDEGPDRQKPGAVHVFELDSVRE